MKVELGDITCATIQMVGNKTNGEGVSFATDMCNMKESSNFIKTLVNNVFKFDDIRHFVFVESLSLNPVYAFVNKIFDDETCFVKQSNNLARYLYDQSLHPNIKNGEFYTLLFQNSIIEGIKTDALLLLKSEKKDAFLTITEEEGKIEVKPIVGLGLKQVDKGCLIFNTHKDDGYIVMVVDNTNSGTDAHYWTESFLHTEPCNDNYHKTKQMVGFCTGLVRMMKKKSPEQSLEIVKAIGKVADAFREKKDISMKKVEDLMSFSGDASLLVTEYKSQYEKKSGALPVSLQIDMDKANLGSIRRMQTLKIGKDYEVKILNPSADIEQGYDSNKQKSYYKLFF